MTTRRPPPKRVLIPIVKGCCEYQTVTLVTGLSRCGIDVKTACIHGEEHNLVKLLFCTIQADLDFETALTQEWDGIVLPGGEEGAETMKNCPSLIDLLKKFKAAGKLVAASGFTPAVVFASIPGFLSPGGTCFPLKRLRQKMPAATDHDVVVQDNVVTCQGIGPCLVFSLVLAEMLVDLKTVTFVSSSIMVDRTGTTGFRYHPPRKPKQVTTTGGNANAASTTTRTTNTTTSAGTSRANSTAAGTTNNAEKPPPQLANAPRTQQAASRADALQKKQPPASSRTDAQATSRPQQRTNTTAVGLSTDIASNVKKRKGRPSHKSVGQTSPDNSKTAAPSRFTSTSAKSTGKKKGPGRPRKRNAGNDDTTTSASFQLQKAVASLKRKRPPAKKTTKSKRKRGQSTNVTINIETGAVNALQERFVQWAETQAAAVDSQVSASPVGAPDVPGPSQAANADETESPRRKNPSRKATNAVASILDENSSDEEIIWDLDAKGEMMTGSWTDEEQSLFLQGLDQYGRDWKKIASFVKTRTKVQVRSHAQGYFQKLGKARKNGKEGKVSMKRRRSPSRAEIVAVEDEGRPTAESLPPTATTAAAAVDKKDSSFGDVSSIVAEALDSATHDRMIALSASEALVAGAKDWVATQVANAAPQITNGNMSVVEKPADDSLQTGGSSSTARDGGPSGTTTDSLPTNASPHEEPERTTFEDTVAQGEPSTTEKAALDSSAGSKEEPSSEVLKPAFKDLGATVTTNHASQSSTLVNEALATEVHPLSRNRDDSSMAETSMVADSSPTTNPPNGTDIPRETVQVSPSVAEKSRETRTSEMEMTTYCDAWSSAPINRIRPSTWDEPVFQKRKGSTANYPEVCANEELKRQVDSSTRQTSPRLPDASMVPVSVTQDDNSPTSKENGAPRDRDELSNNPENAVHPLLRSAPPFKSMVLEVEKAPINTNDR